MAQDEVMMQETHTGCIQAALPVGLQREVPSSFVKESAQITSAVPTRTKLLLKFTLMFFPLNR